jgi:hypothetical protein
MPLVSLETINALKASSIEKGHEKYLDGIIDETIDENPDLFNYIRENLSHSSELRVRDVYEAALLTYRLIHNQLEADILEVAYHIE